MSPAPGSALPVAHGQVTMGWFCRTFKNPMVVSMVFSVLYLHSEVPVLIENLKSKQYLVLVGLC